MIKNLNDPLLPIQLRIYMDEAGRGPLAGPVWVGCTIQTGTINMSDFRDSKVLSEKKRAQIYQTIQDLESKKKLMYGSGNSSAKEIDEYGIIGSLQLAGIRSLYLTIVKWYESILKPQLLESVRGEDMLFMTQIEYLLDGLERYKKKEKSWYHSDLERNSAKLQFLRHFFSLSQKQFVYKGLFIDGNHTFGIDKLIGIKIQTIVKGDAKVPLISAASIVAKVERDEYMKSLDLNYPQWNFGKHKGYGTLEHRKMIAKNQKPRAKVALTSEHRNSFLTKLKS